MDNKSSLVPTLVIEHFLECLETHERRMSGMPTQQEELAPTVQFLMNIADEMPTHNECIEWQWALTGDGYGQLKYEGKVVRAHRLVLQMATGNEGKGLQAAHSCGNRKCCNPNHLRFTDATGNQRDRKLHGTDPAGERNGNAVLTEDDIRTIRKIWNTGMRTQISLCHEYGVKQSCMSKIVNRKAWTHVED